LIPLYGSVKIPLLKQLKLFSKEYYYKHELDYVIVEILDSKYPLYLRYSEIEKTINAGLSRKVPSATLSSHLLDLNLFRNVLNKRKEKNRHTFYSLTKKFKDDLDIQKRKYPTTFAKVTLSLPKFSRSTSIELQWGVPADED
jgi:hypothetical protein